jgi:[acyl-carrier-protein] S-malonyltransferase
MLCLIGGYSDDIVSLCDESGVDVANMNCPGQVVVSGARRNIDAARELAEKMTFKRVLPLNVAGAYHSRLMESASVGFKNFLDAIDFAPPRVEVLTNVTGETVSAPEKIKEALANQIVSPVLFEKCCNSALCMGIGEFFECGAGKTLIGLVKRIDAAVATRSFDKIDDFNF